MGTETSNQSVNIPGSKIIDSHCVVDFRPNGDWKGEYGFDWYRNGDTNENINGTATASNYNDVVGIYDPQDPDYGDFAGVLKHKKDGIDYVKKLQKEEYPNSTVKGFFDHGYYASFLSMYFMSTIECLEGKKRQLPSEMTNLIDGVPVIHDFCKTLVTIKALIKAKNIDRIELECDKSLSVAPRIISPVPNGNSTEKISIRYNYYFDQDHQSIKAFAYHKDGVTRTFAGQIIVVQCKPKAVNVCFVNVKISKTNGQTTSGFPSSGDFLDNQKKNLTRFLAQAHVIPNIVEADLDLDTNDLSDYYTQLTTDGGYTTFDSIIFNGINGDGVNGNPNNDAFAEFLEQKFNRPNVYKVFFVGEKGFALLNGRYYCFKGKAHGIPSETLVIYNEYDDSLVCHEILHCFGLWHSFSNNSDHTFKKFETSNIMDYSNDTYTLWRWQWKKIRDDAKGEELIKEN